MQEKKPAFVCFETGHTNGVKRAPHLFIGLVFASSLCLFNSTAVSAAADENALRAKAIQLFQQGEYAKAVDVAATGLKVKPSDSTLRYYMANSLTKLGRKNESIAQYQQCLATSQDAQMKAYCQQAIATLTMPAAPAAPPSSTVDQSLASAANAQDEANERKQQVLEEKQQQLQALRRDTDRKIDDVQRDVENQLADVPKTVLAPVRFGWQGRMVNVHNQAYDEIAENLRRQAQVKIDALNQDCKNRQEDMGAYYDKMAAVYDHVAPNIQSQFQSGTSLSQVTPKGSNAYVRNIVNYGSDPDPLSPLKAKQGNLPPAQK